MSRSLAAAKDTFTADPDLFERALGNLLDNALRFTPENGSIQIALSERDGDFEVAVSDTGSRNRSGTFATCI